MPAVKFFVRLDLDPICLFVNGHDWISPLFRSDFLTPDDKRLSSFSSVTIPRMSICCCG